MTKPGKRTAPSALSAVNSPAPKERKKAIGISEYQLTRALPKKLQSALPSIEQLEKELSQTKPSKPTSPAKERRRK